mmetsp:Transcript_4544/g.7950  ORF Transcript_4544/g.7950 Transcript_4544/m.7950 type:complete len:181 (-) Transcript_4544:595-1137(-)
MEEEDEIEGESGWKLVRGEVFRLPLMTELLSIFLRSCTQILVMTLTVLCLRRLDFCPAKRGSFLVAICNCWVFSSSISGFVSGRMFSSMGGQKNNVVNLGSALLFPGFVFSTLFLLNLIMTMNKSTSRISIFTLVFMLLLWFRISVPLNLLGGYLAYKMKPIKCLVPTHQIPREVPPEPF